MLVIKNKLLKSLFSAFFVLILLVIFWQVFDFDKKEFNWSFFFLPLFPTFVLVGVVDFFSSGVLRKVCFFHHDLSLFYLWNAFALVGHLTVWFYAFYHRLKFWAFVLKSMLIWLTIFLVVSVVLVAATRFGLDRYFITHHSPSKTITLFDFQKKVILSEISYLKSTGQHKLEKNHQIDHDKGASLELSLHERVLEEINLNSSNKFHPKGIILKNCLEEKQQQKCLGYSQILTISVYDPNDFVFRHQPFSMVIPNQTIQNIMGSENVIRELFFNDFLVAYHAPHKPLIAYWRIKDFSYRLLSTNIQVKKVPEFHALCKTNQVSMSGEKMMICNRYFFHNGLYYEYVFQVSPSGPDPSSVLRLDLEVIRVVSEIKKQR